MSIQTTFRFVDPQLNKRELMRINKEHKKEGLRTCATCGCVKPISGYYYMHCNKDGKSRPQAECKTCHKKRAKQDDEGRQRKIEYHRQLRRTPEGAAYRMFACSRTSAKNKKIAFSLDLDDIKRRVLNGVCEVTGIAFDFEPYSPWCASLDRTVPSLGYTQENTKVVLKLFNYAKNCYTLEDVVILAKALVSRRV